MGATETKLEPAATETTVFHRLSIKRITHVILLSPPMRTLTFEIVRDQVIFFCVKQREVRDASD